MVNFLWSVDLFLIILFLKYNNFCLRPIVTKIRLSLAEIEPIMKYLLAFSVLFLFSSCLIGQTDEDMKIKSVFFGGGSYYIDAQQVMEIREFMNSVEDIDKYQIGISSHTDNIGGVEYNEWLSKMRSHSVIEQLKRLEISEERIIIKDNGQENALYDNNTFRGRLANRRVDIVLTPIYF